MNLVPKQAENSLSLSTTKQVGNSLSLPEKFRQSAQELKQVRTLTGVAMLLAMSVVISFTASVRVTETIKIGLGYLLPLCWECCMAHLQQRLQPEQEI